MRVKGTHYGHVCPDAHDMFMGVYLLAVLITFALARVGGEARRRIVLALAFAFACTRSIKRRWRPPGEPRGSAAVADNASLCSQAVGKRALHTLPPIDGGPRSRLNFERLGCRSEQCCKLWVRAELTVRGDRAPACWALFLYSQR